MRFKSKIINNDKIASQQLIKKSNLARLFSLISSRGPVSRAELAQITKLSPTTVSSLTEELLYSSFIAETGTGETFTSGRKPIMLEINSGGGYIASMEMMEKSFDLFLYDLKCSRVCGGTYEISHYNNIGSDMAEEIDRLMQENSIGIEKLRGISIGIPALIDYKSNKIISSTIIPIKPDNRFYSILTGRYKDIPVLIYNESHLSAYAQKEFGTAKEVKNLVFIDIYAGIGAGIILDGRIYTGSFGQAGEIGHMTIDMKGPRCKCGNYGCLETLASIPAMSRKIIYGMMSEKDTIIRNITGNDFTGINADVIRKAIDSEDPLVMEVSKDTAEKLAFGINNVINLYNPEVIVLGGEVTMLGDTFLNFIKDKLLDIGLKPYIDMVELKYSELEGSIVTLGGAKYLLDNIYNAPLRKYATID